ncbi:MAG: class I SAM-dependent methyltransferase [Acidobacteriota bacterium]|nr:class I SAM-dependent methyltransferase [Acidobacteriota bacterium]
MQAADRSPYRGASEEAIRHHYDIGDAFYELWLDPSLTYSCGLWEDGERGLAAAQRRKLDHLIGAAGAAGAARVLDVGCGWGGHMRRLIGEHEAGHVVGLTLSEAQAASIARWADHRCEVRVENWAEHEPDEPYRAILSVEAFEHFADFGMPRTARVNAYREFFARCHEWLPPGGRLVIQTGVKGNNVRVERELARELMFIVREVFPESELPWIAEIFEASQRRFEVVSVHNDPHDYVLTLGAWLERLQASRTRAAELLGERVVGDYERYLRTAALAYERHHLGLLRAVFERV